MPSKTNILHKIILIILTITLSTFLCFNFALAAELPGAPELPDPKLQTLPHREAIELPNPLGENVKTPQILISGIIKNILSIVGSLALLMFVIGGLMWMLSGGNEQRVKKGKDILTWATLGLVIIFTSYALLRFILDLLTK